ncbi:hypothetical protein AMELA_G00085380 [Ameiurus melas]|uniref:Uncharacterized protein n=1 Tax=Ameiurus melas TaxID=219545 RepID=A0A7J6AUL4_AMEME|nr:hypothetical protein AMELA_G00085380 [Ameiurus melas]
MFLCTVSNILDIPKFLCSLFRVVQSAAESVNRSTWSGSASSHCEALKTSILHTGVHWSFSLTSLFSPSRRRSK